MVQPSDQGDGPPGGSGVSLATVAAPGADVGTAFCQVPVRWIESLIQQTFPISKKDRLTINRSLHSATIFLRTTITKRHSACAKTLSLERDLEPKQIHITLWPLKTSQYTIYTAVALQLRTSLSFFHGEF